MMQPSTTWGGSSFGNIRGSCKFCIQKPYIEVILPDSEFQIPVPVWQVCQPHWYEQNLPTCVAVWTMGGLLTFSTVDVYFIIIRLHFKSCVHSKKTYQVQREYGTACSPSLVLTRFGSTQKVVLSRCCLLIHMTNGVKLLYFWWIMKS